MHLYGTLLFQRSAFFFLFVWMSIVLYIGLSFVYAPPIAPNAPSICTPDAPNAPFGNADFTMFLEVPEKLSFGDAPYCTFAVFSMHSRCTQFDS